MRPFRLAIFGLILLAAACAGGGGTDGPRRNPNLITAQELANVEVGTAYEAVQRLRPQWMNRRGGMEPKVFVDGSPQGMGGLDTMRQYRVDSLREIRFIDPPDATMRWGTGHGAGVIDIITR